ncbi:hypothetical protein WI91_08300 [Burkholderia vietnamiensis]|nr:hypothetical protein WI91_08300 [Burkholderia vietnamiensis]
MGPEAARLGGIWLDVLRGFGDPFESRLERQAGVKGSSGLLDSADNPDGSRGAPRRAGQRSPVIRRYASSSDVL